MPMKMVWKEDPIFIATILSVATQTVKIRLQREVSRPAIGREKAGRDISLESRLDLELDERCRPRFGARFSPKEIKAPLDRAACAGVDFKRLEAGVACLYPNTILAVLNPRVVYLQLSLGSYDVIGAETFVKQISEDAKFPIIPGIINQRRLWKDAFQTQMIVEQPDDTATGSNDRILVERETHSDHGKNFVFL